MEENWKLEREVEANLRVEREEEEEVGLRRKKGNGGRGYFERLRSLMPRGSKRVVSWHRRPPSLGLVMLL